MEWESLQQRNSVKGLLTEGNAEAWNQTKRGSGESSKKDCTVWNGENSKFYAGSPVAGHEVFFADFGHF